MRILQVYRTLDRQSGGIATSVPALCRELANNGNEVTLITLNTPEDGSDEPVGTTKIIELPSQTINAVSKRSKHLSELVQSYEIVHVNGIWPFLNSQAIFYALRASTKVVVSPRGSFMRNDIYKTQWKALKKRIVWSLYLAYYLRRIDGLHVTATNELQEIQGIGFSQPTALIPSGINVDEFNEQVPREVLDNACPELQGKKVVLFLSLLVQKKGLPLLLRAWQQIARQYPDWHLLIVGPDVEGIWKNNKADWQLHQYNITYAGLLTGQARLAAFWGADFFVLPTYWENFGIVLAEALMAKTPIITTTRTPWQFAEEEGFGWIIEPEQKQLERALHEAMSVSSGTREKMGAMGREYVKKHFDWRKIAEQMEAFYAYILGGGNKPDFVTKSQGKDKLSLD